MLEGLISKKDVVNHLYGEMEVTADMRDRCPSALEWATAQAIKDVLDYPCTVVIKAQDKGMWHILPGMDDKRQYAG